MISVAVAVADARSRPPERAARTPPSTGRRYSPDDGSAARAQSSSRCASVHHSGAIPSSATRETNRRKYEAASPRLDRPPVASEYRPTDTER